ncbi:MAG: UTRA domain-containing protein, partial [Alphaproteobacteria bacterium]|nr:UTRA domain-containing protein [Alphaproteobacteria bacterium]
EKVIGEQHNAPILRTVQRMQVTELPPDACQAIGIQNGTIGMSWDVLAYSYRDMPITYQRIYLPPNERRLEVREYRRSTKLAATL